MGSIHLEGIEVVARIGLLEEEQHAPQDLYVTVDLTYDFAKVRESDDLAEGIDYCDVIACVKKFASAYDGKMLERFVYCLRYPSHVSHSALPFCNGPNYIHLVIHFMEGSGVLTNLVTVCLTRDK